MQPKNITQSAVTELLYLQSNIHFLLLLFLLSGTTFNLKFGASFCLFFKLLSVIR